MRGFFILAENFTMRSLLLFLLLPIVSLAQETPEDFGQRVFRAVIDDDKAAFDAAIAPQEEFTYFFKQIDPTIQDSLLRPGYAMYVRNAQRGFTLCREDIAELKLDLQTIKLGKIETADRELLMERNGQTFTPAAKTITMFFTCSGKNFAFIISDAIIIKTNGTSVTKLYRSIGWINFPF